MVRKSNIQLDLLLKASLTIISLSCLTFTFQNCSGGFESDSSASQNLSSANSDPGVPGNIAPTASITSPTSGQQFTAGTTVQVQAQAADSDGQIVRVELYVDNVMFGNPDTTSPYSFNVNGLLTGSHILRVRSVDNVGGTTNSAEISIVINADSGPLANCTAPGYRLPGWVNGSTVNTTFYSGLDIGGPQSPLSLSNDGPLDLNYQPANGTRAVTSVDCNDPNGGIDRNCNLTRLRITKDNGSECSSGTLTINARPNDGCPNKTFPSKVFNINVVNACPRSDVVDAGAAAETQGAFGSRVAIDGDVMVVTAPNATGARNRSGKAFVFRRTGTSTSNASIDTNNWTLDGSALAPAEAADFEGLLAAAVRGNLIALGAPGASGVRGAVYIYERSGNSWNLLTRIPAPNTANPNDYHQFGFQVEILADQSIVVGAPGEDVDSSHINAGAVYIYSRSGNNYIQARKLTASPMIASESFGYSLFHSGSTLVVGAPYVASQETTSNYGSAYIFSGSASTFSQTRKLKLASISGALQFGRSVYTDGSRVAIGAPVMSSSRGGVFLFDVASGAQINTAPILHQAAATNDRLGTVVHIQGNTLYASAPGDETGRGTIYRFSLNGATATQNYNLISRNGERANAANFGNSFAVNGNNIAIGSPARANNNKNNAGVGFVIVAP